MIFRDLIAGVGRRWYLIVAGILATVALGFLVHQQTPATYRASASVVLVPPPTAVISGDNPYLYMGGLDQALSVLSVKLNSDAISGPIGKQNSDATYIAARDTTTSGPIMQVEVSGTEPESTLTALRAVLDVIPETLTSLQDDLEVDATARISVLELAVDEESTTVDQKQTRALLTTVAFGAAGTLLLSGLIDRALLRRQARKQGLENSEKNPPAGRATRRGVPTAKTEPIAPSRANRDNTERHPASAVFAPAAGDSRRP